MMSVEPPTAEEVALYRQLLAEALASGLYSPGRRADAAASVTAAASATTLAAHVRDVLRDLRIWRARQLGGWVSQVPEGRYAVPARPEGAQMVSFEVSRPCYGPTAGMVVVSAPAPDWRRVRRVDAVTALRWLGAAAADLAGAACRFEETWGVCWRCRIPPTGPRHAGCVPTPAQVLRR